MFPRRLLPAPFFYRQTFPYVIALLSTVFLLTPSAAQDEKGHLDSDEVIALMERMVVPELKFKENTIHEVMDFLSESAKRSDPRPKKEGQARGIPFLVHKSIPRAAAVPKAKRQPQAPGGGFGFFDDFGDPGPAGPPLVTIHLRDINLMDALHFVADITGLEFTFKKGAVIVFPRDMVLDPIERVYDIDLDVFQEYFAAVGLQAPASLESPEFDMKDIFQSLGVAFPPKNTSLKLGPKPGQITVINSEEHHGHLAKTIESLSRTLDNKLVEIEVAGGPLDKEAAVMSRMKEIQFAKLSFSEASLFEVIEFLTVESGKLAPAKDKELGKGGLNIALDFTWAPIGFGAGEFEPRITLEAESVSFREALDNIMKVTDDLAYSIKGGDIIIHKKNRLVGAIARLYPVDPKIMNPLTAPLGQHLSREFSPILKKRGVHCPPGSTAIYQPLVHQVVAVNSYLEHLKIEAILTGFKR